MLCLLSPGKFINIKNSKIITKTSVTSTLVKERLSIQGPLQFNKTDFYLTWSDKQNDTYYIQEYLPKGENVIHFNHLLTINLFHREIPIADAVRQKVSELAERKKTDPTCNFVVNQSNDGKEFLVDFIIGQGNGDQSSIVEFNIYHYRQIEISGKKKALVVYAYSERSYGDQIAGFLTRLRTDRIALLNAMSKTVIPSIKINQ